MKARIERFRECVSLFVWESYKRGLEFALASLTVGNAVLVYSRRADGSSLAPFLSSALPFLTHQPGYWAMTLLSLGLLHFCVLFYSMHREVLFSRLLLSAFLFLFYLVVSVAVLTGPEPPAASVRYFIQTALSLLGFSGVCIMLKSPRSKSDEKVVRG